MPLPPKRMNVCISASDFKSDMLCAQGRGVLRVRWTMFICFQDSVQKHQSISFEHGREYERGEREREGEGRRERERERP